MGSLTGIIQRHDLGMIFTRCRMPALAYNHTVFNQDTTHARVRCRRNDVASKLNCSPHINRPVNIRFV
jgi:hypothetical protein